MGEDGTREPDFIFVIVPGTSFVGEEGASCLYELDFWCLATKNVVEFLVKGVIGSGFRGREKGVDGCVCGDGIDEASAEICGNRFVALERGGEEVCIDRRNENSGGFIAQDLCQRGTQKERGQVEHLEIGG